MEEDVIPTPRVEDAAHAVAWYPRFGHRETGRAPVWAWLTGVCDGGPWRRQLFLSEHVAEARPDTLIYLFVRDVDALADEFGMTSEKHLGRTKSNCVTRTGTVYASAQRNREAHRTVSLLGVD